MTADPVAGGLTDSAGEGRQLVLATELSAAAGTEAPIRQVLAVGDSLDEAIDTARSLLDATDPLADAAIVHAALAPDRLCDGLVLSADLCRLAAANLAAARASSLSGSVPADMTGQFVTDDFPQLYPRDALMVARALLAVGLAAEAAEIVSFWLAPDLDRPRAGEWYARYDALGRGVVGGTGAAYDEPEYDSNGYLAIVVADLVESGWSPSGEEREVLLQGLDFLVAQQDADGLWTEGGIIEWSGRLPATTMSNHEGLLAGARLAAAWGQDERAAAYRAAAGMARGGLFDLLELDGVYLADERDGGLYWDSSLFFGPAFGFPASPVLDRTLAFILDDATALGWGVRYFEDPAAYAGGYGADLFFFTTAAAARHAATIGDPWTAAALVEWMAAYSSRYGLAPERVYADGSGAAVASPLSWCAAELGLTALWLGQVQAHGGLPVVDGAVQAHEYRAAGHAVLDHDGLPDTEGDLVAMCAVLHGDELFIGLRTAGAPSRYTVAVGEALVEVGSTCTIDGEACLDLAVGEEGVELVVDASGLGSVLHLVAEHDGALLPARGSLSTAGLADTVQLTFEVDASAVTLEPGQSITLSGDRAELGAWEGDFLGLTEVDGTWTVTVEVERGGSVAYKYLVGVPGDGSWAGVELDGADRLLFVEDADGTGTVAVQDRFGSYGGVLVDP